MTRHAETSCTGQITVAALPPAGADDRALPRVEPDPVVTLMSAQRLHAQSPRGLGVDRAELIERSTGGREAADPLQTAGTSGP